MNPFLADMETLAARVEKLESANRLWKSANAIALLLVISLLLLGTRHAERVAAAARADRIEPDVLHARSVEAQDFVLKDADGHVFARLSFARKASGRSYLAPSEPASGQARRQFYNDKGDVVWTAPSKAQFIPAR